jgi:hypothetical protein
MELNAHLREFLVSTAFVDSDSSEVRAFVARSLESAENLPQGDPSVRRRA